MTTFYVRPEASATITVDEPVVLPISQGKIRLDENYSPYVTANFTVPLTDKELLEQIDPRQDQRVTVKASSTGHNETLYSPWTTQATNLYPNPSFEAAGAAVEVRRNFYRNPLNQGTLSNGLAPGNAAYNTGATTERPAATYTASTGWQDIVSTGINSGGRNGYQSQVPLTGATAGTAINFSLQRRSGVLPANVRARLYVDAVDTGGTVIVGHWDGYFSTDNFAPILKGSITPTAEAATLRWYVWLEPISGAFTGSATAGFAWGTVEVGRPVGVPFTGSSIQTADSDLAPSWTGTVGLSASILSGARIGSASNGTAFYLRSGQWARTGYNSLRMIPRWPTAGSGYMDTGFSTDGGVTRGKTYTALVTVRKATATLANRGGLIWTTQGGAATGGVAVYGGTAPGTYDLRITFTVAATGWGYLRLYHGGTINEPDIWFDDLTIVEGDYTGPAFDGFSESGDLSRHLWTGSGNASTSVWQTRSITGSLWVPEDERTYDLGLRSRKVDHKNQTVEIELASDEILLHDRRNVSTAVDSSARAHEASLRAVCTWALGKIGATLTPGTADADVTARWSAENAVLNPDGVSTGAAYVAAGNVTVSYSASTGGEGPSTGYVTGTSAAAGQSFITVPQTVSTRKGDMWNFSAYMHKAAAVAPAVNGILRVYEMDSAGVVLRQIESTPKPLVSAGSGTGGYVFDRHSVSFTVQNPNTTSLRIYASMMATAAGQAFGVDSVQLTEGPVLLPYFSGARVPAGYVTNWTGQTTPLANNSVSERRPADGVERLPEVFDWKPGQSLFDFLQPLLNASGLRLFCDESRVWRLVDPAEYEVDGYVVAQTGHNATEGNDEITRNDDTWADAVVVEYRYTDSEGKSQTAYDVAGPEDGKTITRVIEREYTGPGAAASILASLQGRGRTQSVTVVGQFTATPGQTITVNLPATVPQTGKVRAATFDLGSGLAELETRGLIDTLPGSWALWDPEQTWSEVDPSLLWKDA